MLKIYTKEKEGQVSESPCIVPGCLVHLDNATSKDLQELSLLTGFSPNDLTDCLDKYEIPRLEKNGSSLLIFTRFPTTQEAGLYTSTLTLILKEDYLILICPVICSLLQQFLSFLRTTTPRENTKLLIQYLTKISQEFTLEIKKIRHNVLGAEKEIASVESEDINVLTKNEEILNQYLSSLVPIRSVIEGMKTTRFAPFFEKEHEALEDCVNAIKQCEDLCDIVLKSIRSLRDAYQIMFTNNLHKTIKLLTALTIILSIPTMIASIYGMNVSLPFAKSSFGFVLIMGFTLILSALAIWIFKKKQWL